MFRFVIRKLVNNRWLTVALFSGFLLCSALVAAVPVYVNGVLQTLLVNDMYAAQKETGRYPGLYGFHMRLPGSGGLAHLEKIRALTDRELPGIAASTGMRTLAGCEIMSTEKLKTLPVMMRADYASPRTSSLRSYRDFGTHVSLVKGVPFKPWKEGDPAAGTADNPLEVMVSVQSLAGLSALFGETFLLRESDKEKPLYARITGVYEPAKNAAFYWSAIGRETEVMDPVFVVDRERLRGDLMKRRVVPMAWAKWNFALDYMTARMDRIDGILSSFEDRRRALENLEFPVKADLGCVTVLKEYKERRASLQGSFIIFIVPVLILLGFYVVLVARMIVAADENDIALLKSRGYPNRSLVLVYLIEGLLLAGATFVAGPPLALVFCSLLGTASGFLDFSNRAAIDLSIGPDALLASFVALVIAVIGLLLPAWAASRKTIIDHKRRSSARPARPFWKIAFLDVVLLGLSFYGLYRYRFQKAAMIASEQAGDQAAQHAASAWGGSIP